MKKTKNNYGPLYNNRLLMYQQARLQKSADQIAADAGVCVNSVNAGLAGNLKTLTIIRALTIALGIDWKFITHTDLPESEFHQAVINGRAKR